MNKISGSKQVTVKKDIAFRIEQMFPNISHTERLQKLADYYEANNKNGSFYMIKLFEQLKLLYPNIPFTLENLKATAIMANNRVEEKTEHEEYASILDSAIAKEIDIFNTQLRKKLPKISGKI